MKQKYIWITVGIIILLIYISTAFYYILHMKEPAGSILKEHTTDLVRQLETKLENNEIITIKDNHISIQKDQMIYTFTSNDACEYRFQKEILMDQEKIQVNGKISVDFKDHEVEIFTDIDEWSEEKNRYENISIGSNRYSLDELSQPINTEGAFVDHIGKALDQHRDIEAYIGFEEVTNQVLQMTYYHTLLTSLIKDFS